MHDSLTIALLQAREAAMSYFRPIVKRHNLTEQQWRIVRVLAEHPSMDFHDLAFRTPRHCRNTWKHRFPSSEQPGASPAF